MIAAKYRKRDGELLHLDYLQVDEMGKVSFRKTVKGNSSWVSPPIRQQKDLSTFRVRHNHKDETYVLSRLVYCTFIGLQQHQARCKVSFRDDDVSNCSVSNLYIRYEDTTVEVFKTCVVPEVITNEWMKHVQIRNGHGYGLDNCEIHHDGWKYIGTAAHQSE